MTLRYLLLGLLVFVIGLVVYAPAATLYGWTRPAADAPPSPVALSGVSGTLFDGQAAAINLQNRPLLSNLSWSLQPAKLLLGRLAYHLTTNPVGSDALLLDGRVGVGIGGTRISDLKLNGGIRSLMAAAGQPFVPVNGQAALNLEHLRLRNGWPSDAAGELQVVGLAWTLARDPVPLGDYAATLSRDKDDLVALIRTVSGPLELNGDARARPDRSYELHLQLKPKPDAPAMVLNLVRSLGQPDAQGYYHIRQKGQAPTP